MLYIYVYTLVSFYDPSFFSAKPISYALRYGSRNLNAALYALLYITIYLWENIICYTLRGTDYRNFMSGSIFYTHSQFIKRFEFML